jgi:membrane-associated protease RseP (regulator of RpoE activity)
MKRYLFFPSRRLTAAIVAGVLFAAVPLAFAKEKPKPDSTTEKKPAAAAAINAEIHSQQANYLGVSIEPLHPAFAVHMPGTFAKEQGLLVVEVMPGSPAAQAGIKADDVLMIYGDQKLKSPEQLAKLVREDKSGRQVKFTIVREGKPQEVNVTIGEHDKNLANPFGQEGARVSRMHWRMPQWLTRHSATSNKNDVAAEDKARWESFDSLTLKSLGKGRYKVEIGYLNKEGKVERRSFEGTREEIDKEIAARKDMPRNEREHLLRSLDLPESEMLLDFPGV